MSFIPILATLVLFFPQEEEFEKCKSAFFERNYNLVIKTCTPLAKKSNDVAQSYLGITFLFEKDTDHAKLWFKKSAELGNADGQNGFGYLYQMGLSVNKDIKLANYWFLKSAEQGNSDSQFWLGENLYLEGKLEEGFNWTKKASYGGSADAQFNLAVMFQKGHGTDKNIEQSRVWYIIAATNDNKKAQLIVDSFSEKLSKNEVQKLFNLTQEFADKNPTVF